MDPSGYKSHEESIGKEMVLSAAESGVEALVIAGASAAVFTVGAPEIIFATATGAVIGASKPVIRAAIPEVRDAARDVSHYWDNLDALPYPKNGTIEVPSPSGVPSSLQPKRPVNFNTDYPVLPGPTPAPSGTRK